MPKRLTHDAARTTAISAGIKMHGDYHRLSNDDKLYLRQLFNMSKYRPPKSASGSSVRMFYEYLCKSMKRRATKRKR